MKLYLLNEPVPVTVDLSKQSWNILPNCMNDGYRPVKERVFQAMAHSLYDLAGRWFAGIKTIDGHRLVVNCGHIEVKSRKMLFESSRKDNVKTAEQAMREYSLKTLSEEVRLIQNDFDVNTESVEYDPQKPHCFRFVSSFKWQLNGHIKPLRNIRMFIHFDEEGNISPI